MMDIYEILKTLPHRYPLLLVDRIIELNDDHTWCRGIKNVTINEPFFQGHYPERPIMPGVLILESMAQVGAAVVMLNPSLSGRIPLLGAVDNAKFRRPVIPGDQLMVESTLLWIRGKVGRVKVEATVDGEPAASAEMSFVLRPKEE